MALLPPNLVQNSLILIFLLLQNLSQIFAEYCRDYGHSCAPPRKCCMSSCCLEGDNDDRHVHMTYYRWNIWNMWYFWFVVVFILMSCFGGCGYYKRRRALLFGQPHHPRLTDPRPMEQPRIAVPVHITYTNGSDNMAFYPVLRAPAPVMSPPAYADVVNKPELYPAAKREGQSSAMTNGLAPPPPYHEVTSIGNNAAATTPQDN